MAKLRTQPIETALSGQPLVGEQEGRGAPVLTQTTRPTRSYRIRKVVHRVAINGTVFVMLYPCGHLVERDVPVGARCKCVQCVQPFTDQETV